MTIPINPVQIHPQFVERQQTSPELKLLIQALQHRQEVDIQRQQLKKEFEQLELNKKLAGPQAEAVALDNEKKKRDLQEHEDDLVARDQALQLYTGNLPRLGDARGIGEVIAGIKDPRVAGHFYELVATGLKTYNDMFAAQNTAATAQQTELANRKTIFGMDQDALVRSILQRHGPQLGTDRGQQRAIAEIAANAGPEAANQVASAFNVGAGRYHNWAGPNGYMYIIDTKNGRVRQGEFVGTKAVGAANQDAVRRGAATIVELLDEQSQIARQNIKGTANPTVAEIAETSRILGVSTEALANLWRSNPQEITRMLKTRFAHNYVGLLPHSRSAANLLRNLTESYWAPAGSSVATLQRAEADRKNLRAIMQDLATGKITDWTRIPGFNEAAAAASAEATQTPSVDPNAPAPNPMDWQQGVPPP